VHAQQKPYGVSRGRKAEQEAGLNTGHERGPERAANAAPGAARRGSANRYTERPMQVGRRGCAAW